MVSSSSVENDADFNEYVDDLLGKVIPRTKTQMSPKEQEEEQELSQQKLERARQEEKQKLLQRQQQEVQRKIVKRPQQIPAATDQSVIEQPGPQGLGQTPPQRQEQPNNQQEGGELEKLPKRQCLQAHADAFTLNSGEPPMPLMNINQAGHQLIATDAAGVTYEVPIESVIIGDSLPPLRNDDTICKVALINNMGDFDPNAPENTPVNPQMTLNSKINTTTPVATATTVHKDQEENEKDAATVHKDQEEKEKDAAADDEEDDMDIDNIMQKAITEKD